MHAEQSVKAEKENQLNTKGCAGLKLRSCELLSLQVISSYCFGHAQQFVLADKSPLKILTTLHETARSNP